MATETVAFSIYGQSGAVVASGNLIISDNPDGSFTLAGINGTVNGIQIDGTTQYLNADQELYERAEFTRYYGFNVDTNGIAFSAGGTSYNLMATPNSMGGLGQGSQTGDALVGSDGSDITVSFVAAHSRNSCFATGTSILTKRGYVSVEELHVGDVVCTVSGGSRPVVWIGHRALSTPLPDQLPIRISAHAFGAGLPQRSLYLSPGHPVLVGADAGKGGHLVPIMCLINGTTIERVPVDAVTYWHVELDAHDILLAEGLPAESYLDWGDRPFFTEGADHALANPDFVVPGLTGRCRPVAVDGPAVEAERNRLDSLFAARLVAACDWPHEMRVA